MPGFRKHFVGERRNQQVVFVEAAFMIAQPKKYGCLYIVCANLQFIGVKNVISICHVMHTT